MSAPTSMSQFLKRPVAEFLDEIQQSDIAARLKGFSLKAGFTDVCALTLTYHQNLPLELLQDGDLTRLQEHLAFYDLHPGFGPSAEVSFPPTPDRR